MICPSAAAFGCRSRSKIKQVLEHVLDLVLSAADITGILMHSSSVAKFFMLLTQVNSRFNKQLVFYLGLDC